ncbi:pyruvate kinase isozyme G, chloroplastic-like [Humulus lupulus]|uniref:pyruvate kinase isozyme G, chloroplastic-like n=1 Tax=Humulus lupulus TaxID=3486 RepID=UPI002B415647|nr:pyruvate kinase isozyme G, chloroplastic-like [Humulus lupulus]
MAALNISTRMSLLESERTPDFLPSSKSLSDFLAFQSRPRKKRAQKSHAFTVRSMTIAKERYRGQLNSPNGLAGSPDKYSLYDDQSIEYYSMGQARATSNSRRKMKIVCTIGPSTSTDKDWEDIKFGVDNQVDFYAVSFVKDARVVHELKDYLKSCNADIHVIVKIENADSIPNLHSIIPASDGKWLLVGTLELNFRLRMLSKHFNLITKDHFSKIDCERLAVVVENIVLAELASSVIVVFDQHPSGSMDDEIWGVAYVKATCSDVFDPKVDGRDAVVEAEEPVEAVDEKAIQA